MIEVPCKVCDRGSLRQQKTYRMSGVVVFIGYILLIPSILGLAISVFMFFGVASSVNTVASSDSSAVVGIAGGVAVFFGIASIVGGLLGWLLIMKKSILKCNTCGAVVNAS